MLYTFDYVMIMYNNMSTNKNNANLSLSSIQSKQPNECHTFLNPEPHTYKNVNTGELLNIGIINASKKVFELGVKYAKDIIITIGTAETTALLDASLITFDHFINKIEENPKISKIVKSIGNQFPKIIGLLDSSVNIFRYIGYDYLTKSYNQYSNTTNPYLDINSEITPHGMGFKKLMDLFGPQVTDIKNHEGLPHTSEHINSHTSQHSEHGGVKKGGMNTKTYDALIIVDKITDDILKLPRELQEDELMKIIDILKKRMNIKQLGGKSKQTKTNKKYRVIRKMIKRTMRKFCKSYPHISK